ncbi:MAG: nitronate monooxygenase family protein [Polyangiaceae bacterium]|nr:nitronate monooxygenase family protein [Polyangiaceae bacterium]
MIKSPFSPLRLRGKELLPVVQGGMGVGISAHKLAGTVASLGGVGTIASIDLRRLHPDLEVPTAKSRDRTEIEKANLTALDREIVAARKLAKGAGAIAVNVMRAVSQYADYVKQSCKSGADAIVMGAGLPLDLPDLTADYPNIALLPILSEARGVSVVLRRWMKKKRLPDGIVLEHPGWAGGHLGAASVAETSDPKFDFRNVIPESLEVLKKLGIERENIPLIPAGGINSYVKIREVMDYGASAVQIGTPFAVTKEGDASPEFKRILMEAGEDDIVEFTSVAGLPARAVRTRWLTNYLKRESHLLVAVQREGICRRCTLSWDCLIQCGLRDKVANFGQFCIDSQLDYALKGDISRGLFFRGKGKLPFGTECRSVRELMEYLFSSPAT